MKTQTKRLLIVSLCAFLILSVFPVSLTAADLLPTGGSEWKYDPENWNNKYAVGTVNCYAYAVVKACATTPGTKIQPGDFSKERFTQLTETNIIEAVKRDIGQGNIYKTTAAAKPPSGWRKVALVIAPGEDYHWYEQNSDGYWSHKQGLSPISNLDASGKKIIDPKNCNRHYSYRYRNIAGNPFTIDLNYSTFCGYYMIRKG
jgi:hypothetical protein